MNSKTVAPPDPALIDQIVKSLQQDKDWTIVTQEWFYQIVDVSSDIIHSLVETVSELTESLEFELVQPLINALQRVEEMSGYDLEPLVFEGLAREDWNFSWEWWDEWVEMFGSDDEWRAEALDDRKLMSHVLTEAMKLKIATGEMSHDSNFVDLAVEASITALAQFRELGVHSVLEQVKEVLDGAAQSALDEVTSLTDADSWEEQVLEAIAPDVADIVKRIGLNLGKAVKATADESITSSKTELESAVEAAVPSLREALEAAVERAGEQPGPDPA